MDELDRKILRLLSADGRMTVKDIARQVSLTSPAAVSYTHLVHITQCLAHGHYKVQRFDGQRFAAAGYLRCDW